MIEPPQAWQDPYCYPGTNVLRNDRDLRDPADLATFEADLTAVRLVMIAQQQPADGRFDLAHLQGIHHRLFSGIYPWAGQLRTVDIAKNGTRFLPHDRLQVGAAYVFDELEKDAYLRGMKRDQAVTRMAFHLGAVNELHPFREGNGRTQRAFLSQVAHQAGWRIAWERLDPVENIAASEDAHHDPAAPAMAVLLNRLVEPARTGSAELRQRKKRPR